MSRIHPRPSSAVGDDRRQWTVDSRQWTVGRRQSAVGSRESSSSPARRSLGEGGSSSSSIFSSLWLRALALGLFLSLALGAQVAGEGANVPVRFAAVEVFMDSGEQALAAWQFELAALRQAQGDVKIVGIEGGEHPAFKSPPYYDPAAMQHDRVVVAAFSTGNDLPKGRTRIARIHVQIAGDVPPEYAIRLDTAGGPDGRRIQATLSLGKGEEK